MCWVAGVERVVVMKGRAAVDALCPIAQNSHVYEEEDDIWDCMLNQVCGLGWDVRIYEDFCICLFNSRFFVNFLAVI